MIGGYKFNECILHKSRKRRNATTYYICDVIVDEKYRGMGIGKALLDAIHDNKEISSLRGILATRDAHELYRKYGFQDGGNSYMGKTRK